MDKMWVKCQAFFKAAYIQKRYHDMKGQSNESMNKISKTELSMYLEAIEMKTRQENKECSEHIYKVTEQNVTLMNLVQDQQKNIEELMKCTKELLKAMSKGKQDNKSSGGTTLQPRDSKKRWCELQRNGYAY